MLNEPAVFISPDVCCGTGFIEVYGSTGSAAIHEIPYSNPRQDFVGQALAIDSTGEVYVTLGDSSVPTLGFAPGASTASVTLPTADNVAVGTNDDVFLERRFTDSACLIQNFSSTIAQYAPCSATQLQNLHL